MENSFERTAMRVSFVSIVVNIILSVFKFLTGVLAHSGAMISDAIHSASDVFSTLVVIVGVRLSGKRADKEHPYGHERMECIAAIILATILCITGLGLGLNAARAIFTDGYSSVPIPGTAALVAAVISIVTKEWMYHYTRINAKKIGSGALMADAWHHRSDALSSVGALIGIAAAKLGFPLGDPVASIVICLLILKASYDIFKDAADRMVDKSCDDEFEDQLRECVLSNGAVRGISSLHTRVFGNRVYVDLEIRLDAQLSLHDTHNIAEQVHTTIEGSFPRVKHIMIHTEPDEDDGPGEPGEPNALGKSDVPNDPDVSDASGGDE